MKRALKVNELMAIMAEQTGMTISDVKRFFRVFSLISSREAGRFGVIVPFIGRISIARVKAGAYYNVREGRMVPRPSSTKLRFRFTSAFKLSALNRTKICIKK